MATKMGEKGEKGLKALASCLLDTSKDREDAFNYKGLFLELSASRPEFSVIPTLACDPSPALCTYLATS